MKINPIGSQFFFRKEFTFHLPQTPDETYDATLNGNEYVITWMQHGHKRQTTYNVRTVVEYLKKREWVIV